MMLDISQRPITFLLIVHLPLHCKYTAFAQSESIFPFPKTQSTNENYCCLFVVASAVFLF